MAMGPTSARAGVTQREIPFWNPEFGEQEQGLVREVLASGYLNEGEVTAQFEAELARTLGARYAIAVTSGTAALFMAMVAFEIGSGDEVIVPDVTFIATANAVCMTGAKPVLVDVDPTTLNIDIDLIESAITPRTKAIIPVHISGRAVDLDAIQLIADRHGLVVIEDAAQALLSRHGGRCLGTLSPVGVVSFSPNKTMTTGQGGALLTDDDVIHRRLRELKDQGRPERGTASADIHPSVGFNFKFTNLQAAVGLAQLARLPERVDAIRQLYQAYREGLADVQEIRLLDFKREEAPQWVDAIAQQREALFAYLAEQRVHGRRFWYPLHTQPAYRQPDAAFPNSTRLIPQALWLPSAFSLTPEDAHEVCGHIRAFYRNHRNERATASERPL